MENSKKEIGESKKNDVQGYLSCVGKEKGLEICGNYDITGVEDIFWG